MHELDRQHPTGKCPAANSRCRACGRLGHWEAACRQHKSTNDGPKPSSQKPRRPRSQSRSGRRGNKQTVQSRLKSLFAQQGVPQRVISDNEGHFSADAFSRLADQWCIDQVPFSPHYPQSNGPIERQVKTVKRMFNKVGLRSDVQIAKGNTHR